MVIKKFNQLELAQKIYASRIWRHIRARTPIPVGVAFPISEIKLAYVHKSGKI